MLLKRPKNVISYSGYRILTQLKNAVKKFAEHDIWSFYGDKKLGCVFLSHDAE
jgi:hypothetical protein